MNMAEKRPHAGHSLMALLIFCWISIQGSSNAATAPDLTIHHVALPVADADNMAKWYVEELGFHIAKRFAMADGRQIVWLDLGSSRLGMMQVPGSARSPALHLTPPADLAFQGYKAVVYAVPDVDQAYRRLVEKGVSGLLPPVSSTPPGIRIAYIGDPEGNVIGLYEYLDPANALRS